jgi:hypothetical protein
MSQLPSLNLTVQTDSNGDKDSGRKIDSSRPIEPFVSPKESKKENLENVDISDALEIEEQKEFVEKVSARINESCKEKQNE